MNAERFWSHVQRGPGCWLWTGNVNQLGYGRVRIRGRLRSAHRVAWELTRGPIPEGSLIRQACRRRACCRPDHLGLFPARRRLSPGEILNIRRSPLGCTTLGRIYNRSRQRIAAIRRSPGPT